MKFSRLLTILLLLGSGAGMSQIVEEREDVFDGAYSECGVGEGLQPCRDVNGETYQEELAGPDVASENSDELAAEAEKIRNESPEELEDTISDMEQDARHDK